MKKLTAQECMSGTDKLCLVINEAHELNNSKGINTQALLSHIHYFKYRIALSATPYSNSFEKYFNCMQLIDSKFAPFTEISFTYYIARTVGDKFNKYSITKYNEENIQIFKNKILSLYFIKRLKSELPEMKYKKIVTPIYFELSDFHKKLYRTFMQEEVSRLEELNQVITLKHIFHKFPYLLQIIESPELLKNKLENTIITDMLNKWSIQKDERFILFKSLLTQYVENDGEKVLIFDNHPHTLNQLADYFSKYDPIIMHGEMKDTELSKKQKIDLFNNKSNKHRVLFANPSVAGVGTNFNKGGRRIIFYTLPFDSVLVEQSLERMYRINNVDDSLTDILIADNTIDVLRYKRNVGRISLNQQFLTKNLTKEELRELLTFNKYTKF